MTPKDVRWIIVTLHYSPTRRRHSHQHTTATTTQAPNLQGLHPVTTPGSSILKSRLIAAVFSSPGSSQQYSQVQAHRSSIPKSRLIAAVFQSPGSSQQYYQVQAHRSIIIKTRLPRRKDGSTNLLSSHRSWGPISLFLDISRHITL